MKALQDKKIAGAGLDVFEIEPLPLDHPYRKLDNVVITPHLGYVSEQNYRKYFPDIVEDIRACLGWQAGAGDCTVTADEIFPHTLRKWNYWAHRKRACCALDGFISILILCVLSELGLSGHFIVHSFNRTLLRLIM